MHDDRGFALVEVIVAAALLVTLAAGVSPTIAAAVREGHASRLRAIATVAASGKIEELRSLPPGDMTAGVDCLDAGGTEISPPSSSVYLRRWTVEPIDGDADVVAIRVDVSTRDGLLRARLVTVRAAR